MACERNKFIELKDYIESLGLTVNAGKNKARGNKGIFLKNRDGYRIDISKKMEGVDSLSTLLHEFAHYLHFKYDSTLTSLDFIFPNLSDVEKEELLNVTVDNVPKDFARMLFDLKKRYINENKDNALCIKTIYPKFKLSEPCKELERNIKNPVRYFFKYDRINYLGKIYSIDDIETDFKELSEVQIAYIRLKNNQKKIERINAKINKLNQYYNQPSELWARFFELYYKDSTKINSLAPILTKRFDKEIESNFIPELTDVFNIMKTV